MKISTEEVKELLKECKNADHKIFANISGCTVTKIVRMVSWREQSGS